MFKLGDLNSIAVFIWQAASPINQHINFESDLFEALNRTSLLQFDAKGLEQVSTS